MTWIRTRGFGLFFLLPVLACGLAGCGEEVQTAIVTAPPVMVVAVEVRDVIDRIEASGQLIAKSEAQVAAQVSGQVTRIYFEEGSAVELGQVLLEIDPERRQLELSSARAMVAEKVAQLG